MSEAPRVFLDTSVLVYCSDTDDPQRQQRSRRLLGSLRPQHRAVISTQVLQEFYVVATRKAGISPPQAREICRHLSQLPTVTVSPDLVDQAIDCHQTHHISFWDALIVVSARSAGCTVLLSQDLNPGQDLDGLLVVHPASATADEMA